MPIPFVDLYAVTWPGRPNTPEMAAERDRVRQALSRLLTTGYDENMPPEHLAAVQWQAVALALVDVLSPEQLKSLVNDLPIHFTGCLQSVLNQARIADFNERDRGHVPLRPRTREEGDAPIPISGADTELVSLLAEACGLFRFYEQNHRAKVARFEATRDSASDPLVKANLTSDITDTIDKAERNREMADKISAAIRGRE